MEFLGEEVFINFVTGELAALKDGARGERCRGSGLELKEDGVPEELFGRMAHDVYCLFNLYFI